MGGIPKCTVSRIVSRVSTALARKQNQCVRWPSTAAERQEIKQGFFEREAFPESLAASTGHMYVFKGQVLTRAKLSTGKGSIRSTFK